MRTENGGRSIGRRPLAGLLIGLLLLSACHTTDSAPPDLLPPAELVPLLADLHLAEACAQHASRAPDTIQALYEKLEADIYQRRHLTRARFNASYRYYANRPDELESIYATLVDTLGLREVKVRSR